VGLRNDRVLFIPWNLSQAGSFAAEHDAADRAGSHHKRKWTVVCRDTPGKPLADVGFGFGTRIHVVGHGAIGDPSIAADHGTGGADVSCEELVELMFQQGLKKRYVGTFACDVCYSALGNPSFAQVLARVLWQKGVKASCVLGYKGSLVSTYCDELGSKHKYGHRIVDVEEDENGDPIRSVKSKYAQSRFFGFR
jgi:hypothetical protein